jgi:hypothetical protein
MTNKPLDPQHPILAEASKHEVVDFRWGGIAEEAFVEVVLKHVGSGGTRRLRFLGARDVVFSDAPMNWGLNIQDVSGRQLEGVAVQVSNFENSEGQVRLLARDVADVTDEGPTTRIWQVLLEILNVGLLRVRSAAFAGRSDECALEADHLHNIPAVLQSKRLDLLRYYLTTERPSFEMRASHVEQFLPLWAELGQLLVEVSG